uniref:NADH dehydrogenase subunit 6 n=1 Tax=Myzostoma seymourcollegiorum TaxID=447489 RepID=A6MVL6_MYZSE|nr:NADH dehydrogenase subunit 6 [Myzostoma seymourcollegiorum]
MTIFLSLTLTILLTSLLINTPLLLGVTLLILSLNIVLITSLLFNSWFSFMIFLIYISGLLVLFSYFNALISNQLMFLSNYMYMGLILNTLLFIMLKSNQSFYNTNYSKIEPLSIMMNYNYLTVIIILLILLTTMISVVKLTEKNKKTLRPFIK